MLHPATSRAPLSSPWKRLLFQAFVGILRTYQRLAMDLRVRGLANIPPGPKIFATNHITTTDPYWVLPFFGEPVHIIIGPGYQSKTMARVYDCFEQINAMPAHRHTVVEKAVAYLKRGESIYTAPEGDLHPVGSLGPFYTGVGRICRQSGAPIIPIALHAPPQAMKDYPGWSMSVEGRVYRTLVVSRGPYYIDVGRPFRPAVWPELDENDDARRIAGELRARIGDMIEGLRRNEAG
jgi:1-acyl-sn-glycerol-3-phosphate acyltransferase